MLQEKMETDPVTRVRACIEQASALPVFEPTELARLQERASGDRFNLVALGEFKRGKSSVLNALLGAEVLPMGVIPVTAIATIVSYDNHHAAVVVLQDGEERGISLPELADYVTEKGNPNNTKGVSEVHIRWPSPWLSGGVQIIDTPGIGSVLSHNSAVTYRFLPQADAVLFLLSVDQPAGQAETEFLARVREYAGRIFFVFNKMDLVSEEELTESVTFASRVIAKALGRPVQLFPVSARLALQAVCRSDESMFAASGFAALTRALESFLCTGKGAALARALAKRLLRLTHQARLKSELELSSLHTPLEELHRKIALFEQKRAEVEQEQHDFDVLLRAAIKRLADETVTQDVNRYKEQVSTEVLMALDAALERLSNEPLRTLTRELEATAKEAVRNGWDDFRRQEDQRIAAEVGRICQRFSARIDAITDELYRFSSELFAIDFETIRAETHWVSRTDFYYKFWDEPTALKTLTTSIPLLLPRTIGRPLIVRQAKRYGKELADTQAGRIRYDFSRRLECAMSDFRTAMMERLSATIEAIQQAVTTGLDRDQQDSSVIEQRNQAIQAMLTELNELTETLQPLAAPPAESPVV